MSTFYLIRQFLLKAINCYIGRGYIFVITRKINYAMSLWCNHLNNDFQEKNILNLSTQNNTYITFCFCSEWSNTHCDFILNQNVKSYFTALKIWFQRQCSKKWSIRIDRLKKQSQKDGKLCNNALHTIMYFFGFFYDATM